MLYILELEYQKHALQFKYLGIHWCF